MNKDIKYNKQESPLSPPKVMIDLPLKRGKIIRNRKDSLRKRVPELRSRGKEAVIATVEP